MPTLLLTHDRPLHEGVILDRPNRFVVRVRFDDEPERVFLGDPGALKDVIEPGNPIVCSKAASSDRKTAYDAIAVRTREGFVSVRAALANDLFERVLDLGVISEFDAYDTVEREPALPDGGRADFLLRTPGGERAYVEVKSCTYAEDGTVKFPDRPTARGRRHLRHLISLHEQGTPCHVVFVVQRPHACRFTPYAAVDPGFARLLREADGTGVRIRVVATAFEPPEYVLYDADLPVHHA